MDTALFSPARTASWAAGANYRNVIAELPAPEGTLGNIPLPSLPAPAFPRLHKFQLSHTMGGTVIVISGL